MGDKSQVCRDTKDCTFESCDPASLLRHRIKLHKYVPKYRKPSGSSSDIFWDYWDISILFDIDYLLFCIDMEILDSLEQQTKFNY